jgi:hypothetical protein
MYFQLFLITTYFRYKFKITFYVMLCNDIHE